MHSVLLDILDAHRLERIQPNMQRAVGKRIPNRCNSISISPVK
jgi:hypothetical protein